MFGLPVAVGVIPVTEGVIPGITEDDVVNDPGDGLVSLIRGVEVTTFSGVVSGSVLSDVVVTAKCDVAG